MDDEVEEVKKELSKKKPKEVIPSSDLLSTGSTLLNLACSGRSKGGFAKGKYYFLVGDSTSGKTFLSLTCLAEASLNEEFADYRFIYDNGEDGALMNMRRFFGREMARRLEPPRQYDDGSPAYSETAEELYDNIRNAAKHGPFIYILDSENSLSSEAERKKQSKQKKAREGGETTAGSYGDNKAKVHSSNLRSAIHILKKTKSILIIIGQSRDDIGGFGFGNEKTHSGGHALKFYATLQMWSSIVKRIKRPVKKIQRQIGIIVKVKIKKNRITGKERNVEFPIYFSHGIDDIGGCIDYLIKENHWKVSNGVVRAKELDFSGKREELIRHIEEEEREMELRGIVTTIWNEIEESCVVHRKRRY